MSLKPQSPLSAHQWKQFKQLRHDCQMHDQYLPSVYEHLINQARAVPQHSLYYDHKTLVGFIGWYFFYTDGIEITLFIHPKYRRRGIGSQLLQQCLAQIKNDALTRIVFSVSHTSDQQWLKDLNLTHIHTEYRLQCDVTPQEKAQHLTFRPANAEDIDHLIRIDAAAFGPENAPDALRFLSLIYDPQYSILVAEHNHEIVSKAHIRWEKKYGVLSDIAVIPELQGKGYGSAIVVHALNTAQEKQYKNLVLDVETHNERALNLYLRLGFYIKNACDYWSITRVQIQNLLANS